MIVYLQSLSELRQWAGERVSAPGGLLPYLAFADATNVVVVPRGLALAKYPQIDADPDDDRAMPVVHVADDSTVARVEVWHFEHLTITSPAQHALN